MNAATALRRACGVQAALLGLFSMHGLAVHGAMHAGHGAEPTASVIAMADHVHDQDDLSAFGTSQERAPSPELLGFAGIRLAILLVGAVAAVLLSAGPSEFRDGLTPFPVGMANSVLDGTKIHLSCSPCRSSVADARSDLTSPK